MFIKKNVKVLKKLLSLYLAMWMVVGMLPFSAFAENTTDWSEDRLEKIIQKYEGSQGESQGERDWWEIIALALNQVKRPEDEAFIYARTIDGNGDVIRNNEILSKSILALRASGYDPMNYYGKDLVSTLGTMDMPEDIQGMALRLSALSSDYYEYADIQDKIRELIISLTEKADTDVWYDEQGNWSEPTGWALYALSFFHRELTERSGELQSSWPSLYDFLVEINVSDKINQIIEYEIDNKLHEIADPSDGGLKGVALLSGAVASCDFHFIEKKIDSEESLPYILKKYEYPGFEGEFTNNPLNPNPMFIARGENRGLVLSALIANKMSRESEIAFLDLRHIEKSEKTKTQLARFEEIEDIQVSQGTSREALDLPSRVNAFLTDKNKIVLSGIRWEESEPEYDPNQIGEYLFEGSYDLPDDLEGNHPKLTCKVIVKAAEDKNIIWAREKMDLIANSYSAKTQINDWWKIAEIGRLGKEIKPENLEFLFRQTFPEGELSQDVGVLLKGVLAIRAMGYDPEDFYGENVVEALVNAPATRGIWDEAPKLWALSSDEWEKTDVSDSVRDLIATIIGKQDQDGLWSGFGGWEDATGFALYALAPYYDDDDYPTEREMVREAVEKAVNAIAVRQESNGDVKTAPGNLNSLVMVAGGLWSCDIKYLKDARLVKNGKTMLDAVREYDVPGEPELLWKKDGTKNGVPMATEQGLRALIALDKKKSAEGGVFDYRGFGKKSADTVFIKKIQGVENFSVEYATPREELKLPSKATLILSDDTTKEVELSWGNSFPSYDPNNSRWYNFRADYTMPEGIQGEKLQARATVTVKAPSVEKAKEKLRGTIDKAKALLKSKDRYEKITVDTLELEVTRSESALSDPLIKYEQIIEQNQKLDTAISGLKENQNQGGGGIQPPSNEIRVYFTLKSIERNGTKEEIWIPREEVVLPIGSKVYHAFDTMTKKYGIQYTNKGNYISEILSPTDGKWFGEFSNGKYSGWMYTVNGKHPQFGLEEFGINDKDEIVWHYTNDYRYEEGSEKWRNENFGSGGGQSTEGDTKVKIDVHKGIGKVETTNKLKKMLELSIDEVKNLSDEKKVVSLDLRDENNLKGFEVNLNKEVIAQVTAENKMKFSIKSNVMEMVLDQNALQEIQKVHDKTPGDVKFEAKKVEKASNIPTNKSKEVAELIGTRPILEITIKVNDQKVSEYPDGKLTFKVPYTLQKGEDKSKLTVYRIEKDRLIEMSDVTFDEKNNMMIFITDHLSYYAIGQKATASEKVKAPTAFDDVTEDKWYAEAVNELAQKGLLKGKDGNNYRPNDKVSRAEFVSILARINKADIEKYKNNVFEDMRSEAWYYHSVLWANANDIAKGYGKTFKPNREISREEMAAMLANYSKYNKDVKLREKNAQKDFADQDKISSWARESVIMMQKSGIVGGKENNLFAPKDFATRAEVAEMIYRMILG